MKKGWKELLWVVTLLTGIPLFDAGGASCAKCQKIEEERAKKQTEEGTKGSPYYEDYLQEHAQSKVENHESELLAQTTSTKPISRSWMTDPSTPSDYMNVGPTLRASDTGAAGSSGNRTAPYEAPVPTVVSPITRPARPTFSTQPQVVQTPAYSETTVYPQTGYPSTIITPTTTVPTTSAGVPTSYPLPQTIRSTTYPTTQTVIPVSPSPATQTVPAVITPSGVTIPGTERTIIPSHDVPQQIVPTAVEVPQTVPSTTLIPSSVNPTIVTPNVVPSYDPANPGTSTFIQNPNTPQTGTSTFIQNPNTLQTGSPIQNLNTPQTGTSTFIQSPGVEQQTGSGAIIQQAGPTPSSIITPMISPQTYSAIFSILQTQDFIKTLNGPFTVFVPSNEAINRVPQEVMQDLVRPENQGRLAIAVGNHIIPFKIASADLTNIVARSISGKSLDIRLDNGIMTVNGVRVLRSENAGINGVIYVIDGVFLY
jgi:uncharacterized surface protein with fasciclin (FAS1) repeats